MNSDPDRVLHGVYTRLTCCGRVLWLRHLETVYVGGEPYARGEDVEAAVELHERSCQR